MLIGIVGAESTGKSLLAMELSRRLADETGLFCMAVPELLRGWCELKGRTPRPEEQAEIANMQAIAIEAAMRAYDIVLCDTTPLMTAVYSEYLFADHSLYADALAFQRRCDLTLLTALDIAWEADEGIRDGAHVREPVDALIRKALLGAGLPWSIVSGQGDQRVEAALNAITPLLAGRVTPKTGLFTRLEQRQSALPEWTRICDCDDPACEHAAFLGASDEKAR